ncbi:sigma-70 family RNA polymerase sigma factor [Microbacterium terrisoli]|uniref:sigma-70 family RNA polymerase sigma factor n=1 Tax=Microbacterium terrisoli TaxID=3242192 RepID=UPI002805807A|nr:sigma-70 family RNA polymerase sigma factor [Microbacterium protaetiae]
MTAPDGDDTALDETADADLVLRSRSGDSDAFGELWRRHYVSGLAVARSVSSSLDPDDLVQEAYTRIFRAIQRGGGPTGAFRAYLFTSIRNTAAAWGRGRREVAVDELDAVADPDSSDQAANDALDQGLTHQAFGSLPTRWQEVLWYSEIEQMKPAAIAPLLGMSANAVAQLAVRAREGLREAWIQAHLRSVEEGSACKPTIDLLGAYSRGNLGRRDRDRVEAHLHGCTRCTIVAGEADAVSRRLAIVLLPLFLGAGATGYAAWLQAGAPVTLVAAMPSSVVQGAVVVGGGSGGGAGAVAGGTVAGGGGAASSGGTASGGGGLAGTAAMVGLVAAGVLVAATIAVGAVLVPRLASTSPADSKPADEAVAAAPAQGPPAVAPAPPMLAPPAPPAPAPPVQPPPAAPPAPAPPVAPDSVVTAPPVAPPTSAPVAPPASAPVASAPPTTAPTPVPTPTATPPALPAGTPQFGTSTSARHALRVTVTFQIAGTAGATVEVLLDGVRWSTVTLDDTGSAEQRVTAAWHDIHLFDAQVGIRYIAAGEIGDTNAVEISSLLP